MRLLRLFYHYGIRRGWMFSRAEKRYRRVYGAHVDFLTLLPQYKERGMAR